ncbi:MAG: hypothetical protein IT353_16390 [Gemmatimonadaceae bacterium]|nr:hypothetical protein [Gemmatimonadaceae bacterium]
MICPACHRWNLSPMEERWEAVERAEQLYRETNTRFATEQIGLAVRRSGLRLIRIGTPIQREFAAWRYGAQLRSRFRRAWLERGIAQMRDAEGGLAAALFSVGEPALFIPLIPLVVADAIRMSIRGATRVRGIVVRDEVLDVRVRHLGRMAIVADKDARWQLCVPHEKGHAVVSGDAVMPMLGRLLPHVNDVGASSHQVAQAVVKVEHFREPARLIDFALRSKERGLPFAQMLGYEQRLALEMMVNEEQEQHALSGELATLHAAWKDAEEIAAIADGLLVPTQIRARLKE